MRKALSFIKLGFIKLSFIKLSIKMLSIIMLIVMFMLLSSVRLWAKDLSIDCPDLASFSSCTAIIKGNISGIIKLWLIDGDGSRQNVFVSEYLVSNNLKAPFFTGSNPVRLELEEISAGRKNSVELDFKAGGFTLSPDEQSLKLNSLAFPLRTALSQRGNEKSMELSGRPENIADFSAKALFRPKGEKLPAILLAAFLLLFISAELIYKKKAGINAIAPDSIMAIIFSIILFSLLAFILPGRRAMLFSIELAEEAEEPKLYRTEQSAQGLIVQTWELGSGTPGSGLYYIALYSPYGQAPAYEELASWGKIRFRQLPTVVLNADGSYAIKKTAYLDAWALP